MQAQRLCSVRFTPLNQAGQRAVEQTLAIVTHGDFPLQTAFAGRATGFDGWSAVYALRLQRGARGLDIFRIRHKMHQTRLFGDGGLQRSIIHVKPTAVFNLIFGAILATSRRICCLNRCFFNSNNLKISQREAGRCNFEQAVMRAELWVVATRFRGDAQRRFAPGHALLQRLCNDNDVVDLCFQNCWLSRGLRW